MHEIDSAPDAVKEKNESIELKTASESGAMQVSIVHDELQNQKKENIETEKVAEKTAQKFDDSDTSSHDNALQENTETQSKKTSHGMLRHRLTLGLTAIAALTALTLNAFDLRSLISQDGKIDRNFVFTPFEDPTHPYFDSHNSGAELKENLIPKTQAGFGKQLIGYADAGGEMVLPAKYEWAKNFSEGLAAVKEVGAETKWGFINHKGEYVIPQVFSSVNNFHNGYALVLKDRKVQIIDKEGKVCSPDDASEVGILDKGYYVFKDARGSLWGLGRGQKILVSPKYQELKVIPIQEPYTSFSSDRIGAYDWSPEEQHFSPSAQIFFELRNKGASSLANKDGKILFTGEFDKILSAVNGHAQILIGGKIGFFDLTGKEVIAPKYDETSAYDDLIAVRNGSKISFIDGAGKPVKTNPIDNIVVDPRTQKWLNDGLGIFRRGKLYGYMDSHGNEVIPARFTRAHLFQNGLARAYDGQRAMFLDTHGNVAGGKSFTSVQAFSDGHASVTVPGPLFSSFEEFPKTLLNASKLDDSKKDTEVKQPSNFVSGEF